MNENLDYKRPDEVEVCEVCDNDTCRMYYEEFNVLLCEVEK